MALMASSRTTKLLARTLSSNCRPLSATTTLHNSKSSYSSAASAAVAVPAEAEASSPRSMVVGLEEGMGLKDYADYRRSLYGQITHKALLVDAVGTLVLPSQPMAQVSFLHCIHFNHACTITHTHIHTPFSPFWGQCMSHFTIWVYVVVCLYCIHEHA